MKPFFYFCDLFSAPLASKFARSANMTSHKNLICFLKHVEEDADFEFVKK
jgi:hypothetical protein